LYLYIPGPRRNRQRDAWYNLLLTALASGKQLADKTLLYEHGDPTWFLRTTPSEPLAAAPATVQLPPISFRPPESERRRGMEQVAPSRREGQGRVVLARLFHPSEGTGTAAGTLYHAWFALIGWLEDATPTENELRATAEKMRADLPQDIWRDLDQLLANFRAWIKNPAINAVLRRSAYTDPRRPAFPGTLARFITPAIGPLQVERERRFLVRDGDKFWNGSFDRVVWLGEGDHIVAADVLDFKTDAIAPGDAAALAARTEHYRPQLEAYRSGVARMAHLPPESIAARLVFTWADRVVEV
jgi:ATP-dependent exoDNAse (exonuclease V) beta subunit